MKRFIPILSTIAMAGTPSLSRAQVASSLVDVTFRLNQDYTYNNQSLDSVSALKPATIIRYAKATGNYEAFLKMLHQKNPTIFRNPVFVHNSGSLQFASLERPRTLLYGNSDLLAFSEPPGTSKRSVEVLSFDSTNGTYSALELLFGESDVKINSRPDTCIACHGIALRPIWVPYDMWPNVFGAFAGTTAGEAESNALKTFLSSNSRDGIFKYLGQIQDQDGIIEGNDNITLYISNMNFRALFNDLIHKKIDLEPWRYALVAAFKGCSGAAENGGAQMPIVDFVPKEIRAKLRSDFSDFKAAATVSRTRKNSYLSKRYFELFKEPFDDQGAESRLDSETFPIADVRYLLENFGFSLKAYQTSNGLYDYSMALPTNLALDWSTQAVQLFPEVFTELKPPVQEVIPGVPWALFDCALLKQKSLRSLSDVVSSDLPSLNSERDISSMGRCISCHVVDNIGPVIPFEDSSLMKTWMNSNGNYTTLVQQLETNRMPKGATLTGEEKASLKKAFEKLHTSD